ncbi:unnamed protein product, partial [Owenia fusiformis]
MSSFGLTRIAIYVLLLFSIARNIHGAPCKTLCARLNIDGCKSHCKIQKGYKLNDKCWSDCTEPSFEWLNKQESLVECVGKCSSPIDRGGTNGRKLKNKGPKGTGYGPCQKICKRFKVKKCKNVCEIKKGFSIDSSCWKTCLAEFDGPEKIILQPCMTKCHVKATSCPPKSDPRYGGNPATKCCIGDLWHTPGLGNQYSCQHTGFPTILTKKCNKDEVFKVFAFNDCRCVKPTTKCTWDVWSNWSPWQCGQCNKQKPCGGPPKIPLTCSRFRYRNRSSYNCPKPSTEKESQTRNDGSSTCDSIPCCRWGVWSRWQLGACSKSCGTGNIYKSRRRIKLFVGTGISATCIGETIESLPTSERCNTQQCAAGCKWGTWSRWQLGACSKTCGTGTRYQLRRRIRLYGTCIGDTIENIPTSERCNTQECPTGCRWSTWGPWAQQGRCSVTCGSGLRQKTRSRTKLQAPVGYTCEGSSNQSDQETCYNKECPHCTWGMWSQWVYSKCDKTCGPGFLIKSRRRPQTSSPGGEHLCSGNSIETSSLSCNVRECPYCSWNNWGAWSAGGCSTTCGPGNMSKTRTRTHSYSSIAAAYMCEGNSFETVRSGCNVRICPDCRIWGEWTDWSFSPCKGYTNIDTGSIGGVIDGPCAITGLQACNRARVCSPCQYRKRREAKGDIVRDAAGVGVERSKRTYGDHDTQPNTCIGDSAQEKIQQCCLLQHHYCSWAEWSLWSHGACSKTCGSGFVVKTRNRTYASISKGGEHMCQGSSIETHSTICNTQMCQ